MRIADLKVKQEELKAFRKEAIKAESERDKSFKGFLSHYAKTGKLSRRAELKEAKVSEKKLQRGARGVDVDDETVSDKILSGIKDTMGTIADGLKGAAAGAAMSTSGGRLMVGAGAGILKGGKALTQMMAKKASDGAEDNEKQSDAPTPSSEKTNEVLEDQSETLERSIGNFRRSFMSFRTHCREYRKRSKGRSIRI